MCKNYFCHGQKKKVDNIVIIGLIFRKFVCMCCWPPARGVCTNYEVVEFQPRTVTPLEPRLCRKLLRNFYLTCPALSSHLLMSFRGGQPPPAPTLPISTCLRTGSSTHLGINYLCPSIPMQPALPLFFSVRASPLQPSLSPSTPVGFLSPPHPCRFQNLFYHHPQLIFRCPLPTPRQPESTPSPVTRISFTNVKNRPGGHPLCHCRL